MHSIATEEEVPVEVTSLEIKALTNKGNEVVIRYSDIQGHLSSKLTINHDEYDNYTRIKLDVECFGYTRDVEINNK